MVTIPRLRAVFRVSSPLFMGNSEHQAEVRAASFKGGLRAWYRAIEPEFREREAALFGDAGKEGQSRVLLRARADSFDPMRWKKGRAKELAERRDTETVNGLSYLCWPFERGRPRTAIPPGTRITVDALLPRPLDDRQRRGLLAAFWLLGRLGSLGSRAARGFGSLALESLEAGKGLDDLWHHDLQQLPIGRPRDAAAWRRELESGLETIRRRWLEPWSEDRAHAHLRPPMPLAVHKRTWNGDDAWFPALATAGEAMQTFRRSAAKGDARRAANHLRGESIDQGPERAAFGMPLNFMFPRGRGLKPGRVSFVPKGDRERYGKKPLDRHASLVRLRLIELEGGLTPLYFQLAGAIPGQEPRSGIWGGGKALPPVSGDILKRFFDHLEGEWTL